MGRAMGPGKTRRQGKAVHDEAEQDKDPKEIPKREKKEVCIIVEPDTRNQTELSPQQVGLKVAMDRVLREKSAAKEMSVPR